MSVTETSPDHTGNDAGSGSDPATADASEQAPVEVVDEVLVEEISIDGMCGVY